MGPQRETFCIFILLSVLAISASKPTIVKDYGPFKPSVAHQFEKREDGKYYLKDENSDSRSSTVEYVVPIVNKTEKTSDNRINSTVAQLATADAKENNSVLYRTVGSEDAKEKIGFSKEALSSTDHVEVNSEHSKKEKALDLFQDWSKNLKKDWLNRNMDNLQKVKDPKMSEELDAKHVMDEEKSQDGLKARDAMSAGKNFETGILISSTPNKKSAVAHDEPKTADKEFVFDDDPGFLSIPMMMSVLPLLLPLAYPSRNNLPLLPLPPALHISDRLPLSDDGESKNMEVPKELVPNAQASKVAQDLVSMILQKVAGQQQYYTPTPLPSLPITPKAAEETEKFESESPKVLDVMGKKFIMKSQTQDHPINGMGRFFIRFMSLRPLEFDFSPRTDKSLEKENSTEVKYPESTASSPSQPNAKKIYDSETHEEKSETNFIPKEVTPEVASSKDIVDNGAKELKALEPIVMKRKLSEDLTTFNVNEQRTKEPEISKIETLGSGNINKKDLSNGQVSDTQEKGLQIEGKTNTISSSHVKLTEDGSLEKSNLQAEVKPSLIPVEGGVKFFDSSISASKQEQGDGSEIKNFNISDKNELLEFRIVTIGYGHEKPAIKDAAPLTKLKAESNAENPKLRDKDMLIKEKKSEGIYEDHEIKKGKEEIFLVPEKRKDSRKKIIAETSGNIKNTKREEKYKANKDKYSDDDDTDVED